MNHIPEIRLEDLNPEDAEITIGDPHKNQLMKMKLRKFTMADEKWLRATFGVDIEKAFKNGLDDEKLCRIAFHQLYPEFKEKFQPQTVVLINDDTGVRSEETVGGWQLFMGFVSGIPQKIDLHKNLMHCLGISRPMWDKIMLDEEKKNEKAEEKAKAEGKEVKKKKQTGRK